MCVIGRKSKVRKGFYSTVHIGPFQLGLGDIYQLTTDTRRWVILELVAWSN